MNALPTRPCRPGDILARGTLECGGSWVVMMDDQPPHPDIGTGHDLPAVAVTGYLSLPTWGATSSLLRSDLIDHLVRVLDLSLDSEWGYYHYDTPLDKVVRSRRGRVERGGDIVATLVADLCSLFRAEGAKVDAVWRAHHASVAKHRAAHLAACSLWQVQDLPAQGGDS